MKKPIKYQEFGDHLVAVYGTLRQNEGNHPVLHGAEFLGEEQVPGFGMVNLGFYPAVYLSDDADKTISVEVYKPVNDDMKRRLDGLEGYREGGTFYDRMLIDTEHGKAWIYFMDQFDDESKNQVQTGDWVNRNGVKEVNEEGKDYAGL